MEGIYESASHFIKLSISLSMKGGSGPLVEEIGISINETLFSSFWERLNLHRIAGELFVHFGSHISHLTLSLHFWGEVELHRIAGELFVQFGSHLH